MSVSSGNFRVWLCGILVLAGCTMHGVPASDRPQPVTPVMIEIDNREWTDYQIFLVREGMQLPLGQVDGLTRRRLHIPAAYAPLTARFALAATTRSGLQSLRSPSVSVAPGQLITWRLEHVTHGAQILVK